MRILFLDHENTLGGGQVAARRLLPLLRRRGFAIDALVGCPQLAGDPIPRTYQGLREAMRRGDHDLVYANTPRTMLAAASTSRPFVWHKHQTRSTLLQRLASRRARRVISVCRYAAPRRADVIPNGVPAPDDVAPADGLPEGPRILMLGRLHPEKGHDVALRALDAMERPATLLVAGPGEWTLNHHPRVSVLGLRSDADALLRASDVLLLASRAPEACPLAVLEAQRAGLPVVATRTGGTPEIVLENKTAFLVPPGDPQATARALDRALAVDRERWRVNAVAYARRFDLDAWADAVADVIRRCR